MLPASPVYPTENAQNLDANVSALLKRSDLPGPSSTSSVAVGSTGRRAVVIPSQGGRAAGSGLLPHDGSTAPSSSPGSFWDRSGALLLLLLALSGAAYLASWLRHMAEQPDGDTIP